MGAAKTKSYLARMVWRRAEASVIGASAECCQKRYNIVTSRLHNDGGAATKQRRVTGCKCGFIVNLRRHRCVLGIGARGVDRVLIYWCMIVMVLRNVGS